MRFLLVALLCALSYAQTECPPSEPYVFDNGVAGSSGYCCDVPPSEDLSTCSGSSLVCTAPPCAGHFSIRNSPECPEVFPYVFNWANGNNNACCSHAPTAWLTECDNYSLCPSLPCYDHSSIAAECAGDSSYRSTWQGAHSGKVCSDFAPSSSDHQYCHIDKDELGLSALEVCVECGWCKTQRITTAEPTAELSCTGLGHPRWSDNKCKTRCDTGSGRSNQCEKHCSEQCADVDMSAKECGPTSGHPNNWSQRRCWDICHFSEVGHEKCDIKCAGCRHNIR